MRIGKKTFFALTCLWTVLAIINFIKGEYVFGALEILIALYNLRESQTCEGVK
jgi:hypothetical protein